MRLALLAINFKHIKFAMKF